MPHHARMPTWLAWVALVWAFAGVVLALLVSRSLHAIEEWSVDVDGGGSLNPGDGVRAGPRVGFRPRG
jgi:hypothetical protein